MHNIYSEILIELDMLMMENEIFCSERKVPFAIERYNSIRLISIIVVIEWTGRHP